METVERRLAAVLALDVVGYSRLMGEDEAGTLQRFKAVRAAVVDPALARHHGRVVKLMGDGLLVDFDSAVNAVACAVEIQDGMRAQEKQNTEVTPMRFRIGINSGDVIIDGDDIYGDGVNIAARLESIADPGGIFVSAFVYAGVHKNLPARFESLGKKKLKNIESPVAVYRVVTGEPAVKSAVNGTGRRHLLAAAVVALAVGALAWWVTTPQDSPPTTAEHALPHGASEPATSPDAVGRTPVIAVLPLDNFSGDPEQDYFSDGLTEDLITDISKLSGMSVIARNSTFSYKGKAADVREVGIALGATHVVEGSVRKAGDTVRITVQLIDAADARHLWAERYDRKLEDIFAIQDEVVAKIVNALAAQFDIARVLPLASPGVPVGTAQAGGHGTSSVEAYEAFLQGWALYNRPSPESFAAAVPHFERALEIDPAYARAHAALASIYWEAWKRFWQRSLGLPENFAAWERADHHLQLAMRSPTPLAYRVSSEMLLTNRRFDQAISEARSAIAMDSNDALGYVVMANANTFAGDPDTALDLVAAAMQIDPRYPPAYLFSLALAEFGLERYEDAAQHLLEATSRNDRDPFWFALLVATYGQMGATEKAAAALARLDELQAAAGMPRFTIGWPTGRWPYRSAQDSERLREGLLAGGLPEG
jgi:TolB-like protein/Flp pilus assembly protein TadD